MKQPLLRVAVVGAGPAGLYATGQLVEQLEFDVEVDVYDRLPTPHGLVRAGVAPDHPEKNSLWIICLMCIWHTQRFGFLEMWI